MHMCICHTHKKKFEDTNRHTCWLSHLEPANHQHSRHFVLSSLSTIRTTAGSFSRRFFVVGGGLALIASRSSGSRRCGVVVVDLLHGRRGRSRRGDGGLVVSVVGVGVLGHGEGGGDGLVERGHHSGIHTGLVGRILF